MALLAHKDDAAVIDVGSGRSAGDEVGETLEETCRIVLGEKRRRVEPERPRALERGVVDDRAGGVVGGAGAAVGAVGVGGERRYARPAAERDGERQRIFLVRPAAALASDRDGELAAGDDG